MSDRNEPDLEVLHRAVLREKPEPFEGQEPVPWWMKAAFVLLIAWGGWYLGRYDAKFDPQRADMQPLAGAVAATPELGGGDDALIARGRVLYGGRCAACHQATGQGLTGVAPPLAGSEWVTGDPEVTARIVLHGLTGPVTVAGTEWNGVMPAWGATMTDDELGAVLSYVRTSWDNSASVVQPDLVRQVRDSEERSTPWTAQEL